MDLSLRELAGRLIVTGIPGPVLDPATRTALVELGPGGIILFKRNCENPPQLADLVRQLHDLPSQPLVAIDHEGGKVHRLDEPFTHFPPARHVSGTGDPELAYAVGRAMAVELAAVGIDIDFAPVLDVDSNPRNPIIGERSFGSTPEQVTEYALALLRGLRDGGIIPCGKHFPGHGDTDADSHLELPVVRRERADLERTELPPFRAAIAAGVPLLMSAHVVYTALDERRPATLSRRIMHDLLRTELGFAGVLVSDDLEMRGVSAALDVPDAAVESLQAGVDWLLVCNDFTLAPRVAERVMRAVEAGDLGLSTLRGAAARIDRLPRRTGPSTDVPLPILAHRALNERIRSVLA